MECGSGGVLKMNVPEGLVKLAWQFIVRYAPETAPCR
jgi:hypothetical protein